MQCTSKAFTANYLSRQSCTGYSSYIGPSGHSNTLLSSYISRENSSDSTTWGVRLYARENTHAPLLWMDSAGCLVIPFSQLSENLSGHLSPNLSPSTALRARLSLKMDTKSSKVGTEREGGEGWGVEFAVRLEELWGECNQRSYRWWCFVKGTEWVPQGNSLMKRMLSTCHMPHDKKKSLFHVGGWSISSVCVPVSKAEHLRENLKAQTVRSTSG